MSKVIGLAGNMGSGKSLVAAILRELGAAVIDADGLARRVVEPGQPAYLEIIDSFGAAYLSEDGTINRKSLAKLVFSDENARKRLNAITHPPIRRQAADQIAAFRAEGYDLILLEAALLIENGSFRNLVDETWLVVAPPELIYSRLQSRDGLLPEEAKARLAAQTPPEKQAALADRVIVNDGSKADLQEKLAALYAGLLKSGS